MVGNGRRRVGTYVRGAFIVILALLSLSILWTFWTTGYPTHADLFWMGVEFGTLLMGLLLCLFLIGLSLYRFFYKKAGREVT
jgi:hypothetical protein